MSSLISSVAGLHRVTCCHFPPTRCVLFSTGRSFVYVFCFPPGEEGSSTGFLPSEHLLIGYCFTFLSQVYFGFCPQGHVAEEAACEKGTSDYLWLKCALK